MRPVWDCSLPATAAVPAQLSATEEARGLAAVANPLSFAPTHAPMRYRVLASLLAALALSSIGLSAPTPSKSTRDARPNVILILADDLGYGDLGCFGQEKIRTPNLDRLAAEGTRFTHAYAGATVCSPSRSVLMTGQHTGHTRVRGNMATHGGVVGKRGAATVRRMHLTDDDRTIGHVLTGAGYRTGVVGKWHLDGFNPQAGPLDRGFHYFHGWLVSEPRTYDSTYFPSHRFRNRELVAIPANQGRAEGYYHPDMCLDEAEAFIRENRKGPFFLYLAFNLPHSPYRAPNLGAYASESWPEPMKHYAAMVQHLDASVGRLLQFLAQEKLDERTLVLFSSDNGPRSEPEPVQTQIVEFFDSNGPLRGYKRDLYDGGIRVPTIARWTGRVPAGHTSAQPWYFADLLPTLAELAGAPVPKGIDGISIVPTLLGGDQDLSDRFLYWEDVEGRFRQAVRWGRWKATRRGLDGSLELYDVVRDPGETQNVAAENANVVRRIEAFLATARTDSPEYQITSAK